MCSKQQEQIEQLKEQMEIIDKQVNSLLDRANEIVCEIDYINRGVFERHREEEYV